MITVLMYVPNSRLYIEEFDRRFLGNFSYQKSNQGISWDNMRIIVVNHEPRGYIADIAIGFNQDGVDIFTQKSCINIKEKRTTTYFDLLSCINNDGSFNWSKYLTKEDEFIWFE